METAKNAHKLEKSRGRFPWPDVEKMTLSARQELAEVMFKNGHYAAGKALSPNTDVGYLAGARPIMKTFDPEVEKIGRVHEAIQRAKESLEDQHRQEDNKGILRVFPDGIPMGCPTHGDACPDAAKHKGRVAALVNQAYADVRGAVPQPPAPPAPSPPTEPSDPASGEK